MRDRIAQIGDPEVVAAAAQEESQPSQPGPVVVVAPARPTVPALKPPMVDTKWFAIAGALVLGFGTFLLPIGGWVVGVALVTSSRFWRRWEKTLAILLPFAVWATVYAVGAVAKWIWVASPADGGASNPLLPMSYEVWSLGFLVILAVPIGTLWLLWRLRGREKPLS
ncbi:hypothetical protein [Microbacterium xylanilyticum]